MKNIHRRQQQVMIVCIKLPRKKGVYVSWYYRADSHIFSLSCSGTEILVHSVVWTDVYIIVVLLHVALELTIVCLCR